MQNCKRSAFEKNVIKIKGAAFQGHDARVGTGGYLLRRPALSAALLFGTHALN